MSIAAILKRKPFLYALVGGVASAVTLNVFPNALAPLTRALAAWDAALIIYIATLIAKMRGATPEHLGKRAAETDEGRHFVLFVSLLAVAVSIGAIIMEASATRQSGRALHLAFVFATVALSWFFVHATFATHYAHEFYGADEGEGKRRGGLMFPGDHAPDFWDFLHFALVIGVANQTADVQINQKPMRRIVTIHGVAAFLFNTVILALAINLAAGLFG